VVNQVGLLDVPAERDEAIESQFSRRRPAYSRRERVTFTTLDRYCELKGIDAIDVIKIDVDGYDQDVVLGGRDVLRRSRPLVLCEFCDRVLRDHGTSLVSYVDLYDTLGYDRYVTRPGQPPRSLRELLGEPDIANRTVNALLLPRDA
jgi:hypothetical protein